MNSPDRSARRRTGARRIAIVLTTALTVAACGGGGGPTDTLSIGYSFATETFDPVYAIAGAQGSAHIDALYGSLLERGEDQELAPGMAESWEWVDPTTLVLRLREGMTFTDGEVFDAAAVKTYFDYFREAPNAPYGRLDAVDEVVVEDPYTVRLDLDTPDPTLLNSLVGHAGSVPSPLAIEAGDLEINPVGAGPYTLDQSRTTPDSVYTYRKNPDYWDAAAFEFETLELRVYTDANAMYNALVSGQADVGYGDASNVAAAENTDLEIHSQPHNANGIQIFDLAGDDHPQLADVRVRRAMQLAVDRQAIIDTTFQGRGTPSVLTFTPGTGPGYDESLLDYWPYDPDEARRLLAEAGQSGGFAFEAVTLAKDQPMAEAVAGYLSQVGITMNLVVRPPGETANTDIGAYTAAAAARGLSDGYATPDLLYLGPVKASNQRGYEVAEIRTLYDAMLLAQGERQDQLMRDIARVAVEGAYSIQVGYVDSMTYYDPEVLEGVHVLPGHGGPYLLNGLRRAETT
ncbi:ABC transporter substrate-binding protein [Pseudonocardia sp. ICBG1293]|uniref:ABC transporter substrate-binding protein n=1 Tax=Pseudonocardia sp. ICBG1293 TaxID=2844382 RepID=UPI001CCEA40D|nr:ABC transporter substrate-binding protein [Pseudonocardia sp. ICBG1293]